MRFVLFLFCLILLSSCFLIREYRASTFSYTKNGEATTMPLVVPKGFVRQSRTDTAGISLQSFEYPGGAVLYAAYLKDTSVELQSFDKHIHQPLQHRLGGQVYKGQDSNDRFYREIRQGRLRFGYRNVSDVQEGFFDSATNHASLQRR